MADVYNNTRFITVASTSDFINDQWKIIPSYTPPPPVHRDYALMKVLSRLRLKTRKERYRIHTFQREKTTITPIDFSGLQDTDVIFIVGHGNQNGLFAMGPRVNDGCEHLVKLLTGDGNLKAKRADKDITILLLSCRSGLGFHKALARTLFKALGRDLNVGGAIGFTFGSIRTSSLALNEVLIKGIPWRIDFPTSITESAAEKETSKRENKKITIKGKKKEIDEFKNQKSQLENGFKAVMRQLISTAEVNDALDALERHLNLRSQWSILMEAQFGLYLDARKSSNLEFDMWHYPPDGYVWTTGKKTTDAEVAAILTGDLTLLDNGAISVQ
jgi:hypothetical protein